MTPCVYDTVVLIAAEANDRRVWADHRVRLEAGVVPVVPAPVVAQASRSPRQVQLRRLLAGCEVVGFDEAAAHRAGALLAQSGTRDVADAAVVDAAVARNAEIVSQDVSHMDRLLHAANARLRVRRP